jgi:hypothetical protein
LKQLAHFDLHTMSILLKHVLYNIEHAGELTLTGRQVERARCEIFDQKFCGVVGLDHLLEGKAVGRGQRKITSEVISVKGTGL